MSFRGVEGFSYCVEGRRKESSNLLEGVMLEFCACSLCCVPDDWGGQGETVPSRFSQNKVIQDSLACGTSVPTGSEERHPHAV